MKIFFRSLALKVNILITIILAVALGISSFLTKRNLQQQAVQEAMTKASIMTATVMNSIIVEMSGFCQKDVQKIVANLGAVPEITVVRIFDEEGIITYSADPEEVGRAVDELDYSVYRSEERARPFRSVGQNYRAFCMVQPIENSVECRRCHGHDKDVLGVLDVCVSMAETEKRIAESARFLFASTVVTVCLVVLAISLSLWFMVNVPVHRMVRAMARAERGNLKARAEVRRRDELGRLAENFNSMLAQLDRSEQELKRYHAEQLKRADRLATLGELAAGIAHEIKNPLAGIAGATQILAREFGTEDPRYPVTQEILKLIERLDTTIRDLLDFARPSEPEIVETDIPEVIRKVMFLTDRMPERKRQGVQVTLDLDPTTPKVPADPDLLMQVFLNLTVNAIQAMPQGGMLTVSLRAAADPSLGEVFPPQDYIQMDFADTGSGIDEDKIKSIFTPFFTTKTQGTGLGLPIALRIVEQHHGHLSVSSVPGQGTVFRLYLPRTRGPRTTNPPRAASGTGGEAGR